MKDRWKVICMTAVFVFLIITAHAIPYGMKVRRDIERQMDKQELHYDADNYFLMLDATHGLAGFYYATTPLAHMRIKTEALNGVYDAYFHGGEMFLELVSVDATIEVPLTKKQAKWIDEHYKDGYPALVYRE